MRVVILTSLRHGPASRMLPVLIERPEVQIQMVVLSDEVVPRRSTWLKRRWRKLRRIGVLGGLVGLYLRRWNLSLGGPDIEEIAPAHGVPVERTPRFRSDHARELVRRSAADLGVTMGTPIIPSSIFSIPPRGMINVHGDVLPRFRGGHSVLWPIYEGVRETGFSIHRIDSGIDTGPLLHVERFPIEVRASLRETYQVNVAEIQRRVPPVLADVLSNFDDYLGRARVQTGAGTTYTTPTLLQFLRMIRQHRRMRRAA